MSNPIQSNFIYIARLKTTELTKVLYNNKIQSIIESYKSKIKTKNKIRQDADGSTKNSRDSKTHSVLKACE